MIRHVVRQGETMTSIAFRHGFFPQTLWTHAENGALRTLRGDPDILFPGDEVVVPDLRIKDVACETARRHRFRRKGVPARTRIQVFAADEPRANQHFTLTVDERESEGQTDGDGVLEAFIPPDARSGVLVIGPDRARFEIAFGHLDPITEISGVQQRLENLGFACGDPRGELGPGTAAALRRFQTRADVEPSGAIDDATIDALRRVHDERGGFGSQPEGR